MQRTIENSSLTKCILTTLRKDNTQSYSFAMSYQATTMRTEVESLVEEGDPVMDQVVKKGYGRIGLMVVLMACASFLAGRYSSGIASPTSSQNFPEVTLRDDDDCNDLKRHMEDNCSSSYLDCLKDCSHSKSDCVRSYCPTSNESHSCYRTAYDGYAESCSSMSL